MMGGSRSLPPLVYVLDFGDFIKIGRTIRIRDRINAIQSSLKKRVVKHSVIECPCYGNTEYLLLEKLSPYKIKGEYFSYPYEDAVFMLLETAAEVEKNREEARFNMTIQEKIGVLMVRRGGISAAELSRKLQEAGLKKLSPQTLSNRMKRGKFTNAEIQKIAEVLNCEVELLPPPPPIFKMIDTGDMI